MSAFNVRAQARLSGAQASLPCRTLAFRNPLALLLQDDTAHVPECSQCRSRTQRSQSRRSVVARAVDNPPPRNPLAWLRGALSLHDDVIYSSGGDWTPPTREVAALWAKSFDKPDLTSEEGVARVATALANSFTVQYAFKDVTDRSEGRGGPLQRQLVGTARTISDGYFAAQILDVCVAESHRGRGIATQLVQNLCTDTRAAGPRSLAVFVGPVRAHPAGHHHVAAAC